MKHPTKEQMDFVISKFKTVEDQANEGFNIETPFVRGRNCACGTVHCVAGWYAVANIDRFVSGVDLTFTDGARLMAKDLGFNHKYYLEEWAMFHADIWGNDEGVAMFYSEGAYNGLEGSSEPMTAIIKHLEGVRDRLPI